jgi:hypothetical protein
VGVVIAVARTGVRRTLVSVLVWVIPVFDYYHVISIMPAIAAVAGGESRRRHHHHQGRG